MVKRSVLIWLAVLLIPCGAAWADLVITEVMAYEPDGQSSLEWIEIYNDGPEERSLYFYQLYVDDQMLSDLSLTGGIVGYEYIVIVKRITSGDGETGFEEIWGNNNGAWIPGEPGEDYKIYESADFNLNDNGGTVSLKRMLEPVSTFTWSSPGFEGVSWERYSTVSPLIGNCTDPQGGTPGHDNSISLRQYDLDLESADVEPAAFGLTHIEIKLTNRGVQIYDEGNLALSYDPDADGIVSPEDLIAYIPFPQLLPDHTVYVLAAVEMDGVYNFVNLKLPDDDWPKNNDLTKVAPGAEFPPLILNEIMADPKAPLATEWVEILNRSEETIDLSGWLLGNADILYPITLTGLSLEAGQFMILCKDSLAFVDFYGEADFPVREPNSWPTLRNNGDSVYLTDNYGFEADTFYYTDVFGDNYSWGRTGQSVSSTVWGQSRDVGGTPGQENSIFMPPSSPEGIEVVIDPNPFSYSRDEFMRIEVSVPAGESMSMKVFDRNGREVRTLIDNAQPYDESLDWNGYSDGGRQLPPGIYILYIEVSGSGSVKRTIVLSP